MLGAAEVVATSSARKAEIVESLGADAIVVGGAAYFATLLMLGMRTGDFRLRQN